MMNFEIEVLIAGSTLALNIEVLDHFPDSSGYLRFKVSQSGFSAIMAFDSRYWIAPLLVTPEDAEHYYEIIHYPDIPAYYVEDHTFLPDEIESIRQAVGRQMISQLKRNSGA